MYGQGKTLEIQNPFLSQTPLCAPQFLLLVLWVVTFLPLNTMEVAAIYLSFLDVIYLS